ncbi:extracellular solute-binding protein [Halalkalibaculum sp. DA3122]|uniref:extracellular solute-binding protein n=1 Tax=Halalkalibaculum sp. DA3122 TaxID=3373607 RepID=UPI0037543D60
MIYSGRSQALVDDLVDMYNEKTGEQVEVRYGNDAELLALLAEEGEQSPADIFWANTTGALANASSENRLQALPDSILALPSSYTASSGQWIPVTVRFRVLAYNPQNVSEEELPSSISELTEMTEFEGRVGWTPTYSSFYDFITAMRIIEGEEFTLDWIEGMKALNPVAYSSNTPMVQALVGGEIDMGLTNHYYVLRMKYGDAKSGDQTPQPDAPIETHHFESGDLGNLALVTGAALLNTSDQNEQALRFLKFLVSEEAQSFAVQSVNEYPVIDGVEVQDFMLDADQAFELSPEYDYEQLQNLEGTLDLLRKAGLN